MSRRKPKISNNYSENNFNADFTKLLADLNSEFTKRSNLKLKRLTAYGRGTWIIIPLSKKDYAKFDSRTKRSFDLILQKHVYKNYSYAWGSYKEYWAIGPGTRNAHQKYGGPNNYRTITLHH